MTWIAWLVAVLCACLALVLLVALLDKGGV